jgi:hypothetical protein
MQAHTGGMAMAFLVEFVKNWWVLIAAVGAILAFVAFVLMLHKPWKKKPTTPQQYNAEFKDAFKKGIKHMRDTVIVNLDLYLLDLEKTLPPDEFAKAKAVLLKIAPLVNAATRSSMEYADHLK